MQVECGPSDTSENVKEGRKEKEKEGERKEERKNRIPGAQAARGGNRTAVTVPWFILPVVICLSQRLSHACLSASHIK